jgi:hypothetical protein
MIPRMCGNRRMDRNIRTSILVRLASRSVTGHDPPPQVHQHGNADLLVCGDTCVRRRFVYKRELNAFCSDLLRGGSLGVYSCVVHPRPFPHHVELCLHTNREDALWVDFGCGVCFESISGCRCTDRDPMLSILWPRGYYTANKICLFLLSRVSFPQHPPSLSRVCLYLCWDVWMIDSDALTLGLP